MTIGNKIYELRSGARLSQEELAEKLGVSRQSVSKWETDAAQPEFDKLIKICDLFGISLDEFAGRAKITPKAPPVHPNPANRVIGYILMAAAIAAGILVAIFPYELDFFILAIPSVLACSLICIFKKEKTLYWCLWTLPTLFSSFNFYIISLQYAVVAQAVSLLMIGVLMAAGDRLYRDIRVKTDKNRSIAIIIGWAVYIAVALRLKVVPYIYSLAMLGLQAKAGLWMLAVNHILIWTLAPLWVYTICYIRTCRSR